MKHKRNYFVIILSTMLALIMLASIFLPHKTKQVNAQNGSIDLEKVCHAKSMCVIEQTTGRVLLEKNMNEQLAMASTTKIMTALVALERTENLDEQFLTDNRAVGIEGTSIYLKKDEKLSMRELLYGLMLNSGNDAAMAIAYKVGEGDEQKFVQYMNEKASELNLKNTHFDNPHGLDSKTHYTSSYDLAMITAKAMENSDFREIVKTEIKEISAPKEMGHRFVRNKQKLLKTLQGCDGVKSGFTDNARRCLVTSCTRNNMRLICVVLNCNDMFLESRKLLDYCFENYYMQSIIEPYQFIDDVLVNDGTSDKVKLYVKKGYSYPIMEKEKDNINVEYDYPEQLEAPIKKDSEIGEIKVYLEKDLIYSAKICTIESVKQKDTIDKMKDIFDQWYLD